MNEERRWIAGVDEPLPAGEEVLWSGAPDARAVARHVLHVRAWGVYMGLLTLAVGASAAASMSWGDTARLMVLPLLLAALLLAGISMLARLVARTTEYVVTSRRVVLRVGIAFPIVINVPLRLVEEAGVRSYGDGSGEVRLSLAPSVKLAYIALWPHVDAFRGLAHPRPKLRGLAQPGAAASALRRAVAMDGGGASLLAGFDPRGAAPAHAATFTSRTEAMAQ